MLSQLRAAIDPTVFVEYAPGMMTFAISKDTAWTPQQITAARSILDAAPDTTPGRTAQTGIDGWSIEMRALVLTLIDQINVLRQALPTPLPAITPAQALAAIRTKAGTL